MLQYVIVCIIIACAAFYLVWRFRQTARRIRQQGKCADCPLLEQCGKKKGHCSQNSNCPNCSH